MRVKFPCWDQKWARKQTRERLPVVNGVRDPAYSLSPTHDKRLGFHHHNHHSSHQGSFPDPHLVSNRSKFFFFFFGLRPLEPSPDIFIHQEEASQSANHHMSLAINLSANRDYFRFS